MLSKVSVDLNLYLKGTNTMKATGIVRRIDDLGRVVIPKEIRRTMRIREGDPLLTTITQADKLIRLAERLKGNNT